MGDFAWVPRAWAQLQDQLHAQAQQDMAAWVQRVEVLQASDDWRVHYPYVPFGAGLPPTGLPPPPARPAPPPLHHEERRGRKRLRASSSGAGSVKRAAEIRLCKASSASIIWSF